MSTPPLPLDPESLAALKRAPFELEFKPFPEPFWKLFKECTPRLLVVTDGLNFDSGHGFGLTQFVDTLKSTAIHGMLPEVVTAHRGVDDHADIPSFTFDATVTKSKYDVIFLFGVYSAPRADPGTFGNLAQAEVDVIEAFMESGGGVFATGDHEGLGSALCGNLPRVRSMRYWYSPEGPSATSSERITTNSPGENAIFEFNDQSDSIPQRIYPRYFESTTASFVAEPHALLQAPPPSGSTAAYEPIEVAPDHPHEGECVEPVDLTGTFELAGKSRAEWPAIAGTKTVLAPQVVAYGMTYGGTIPTHSKHAVLAPRAFGVVGAYDGQQANVGRVAVDSTWHHFINVNIDGTSTDRNGLREPLLLWPGLLPKPFPGWPGFLHDTHELKLIRRYWGNLANWLMPATTRKCLTIGKIFSIVDSPFFLEELLGWPKGSRKREKALELARLGESIVASLRVGATASEVETILDDLTELTLGSSARAAWKDLPMAGERAGLESSAAHDVRHAALAGVVLAVNDLRAPGRSLAESIEARGGSHAVAELVIRPARAAANLALAGLKQRARRVEESLGKLEEAVQ